MKLVPIENQNTKSDQDIGDIWGIHQKQLL